jgi:GTPase
METLPVNDPHLPHPAPTASPSGARENPAEGMGEVMGSGAAPGGFRSGFVALIGRPNVGKSTLVNQLVGQKVAITSPVAQTTRNRLRAILTTPSAQLVLLDTPGIHKPHHLLGERLVRSARSSIGEVDVVLLLVDGSQPAGRGDAFVVELLRQIRAPVHVVLNKCDQVPAGRAQERAASYRALVRGVGIEGSGDGAAWPLHRCSALTGEGCTALVEALAADLPPGPHLYPADAVSDQPERLLLAELVREQVLTLTREEVPHSVAVQIERIVEDGPRIAVLATVLVERTSQKGILIGRGGAMLKAIGQGARLQMQKVFEGPVYLELFVKVVPNWRRNPSRLNELGYGVE